MWAEFIGSAVGKSLSVESGRCSIEAGTSWRRAYADTSPCVVCVCDLVSCFCFFPLLMFTLATIMLFNDYDIC